MLLTPIPRIADYPFYKGFNTAIPNLYFGEYTQEQRLRCICEDLHRVQSYAAELGIGLNLTNEQLEEVISELEELQHGGWFDIYADELEKWIKENLERLIGFAAKMVFFGLTSDGYFCAYIPSGWSEIQFDTGMVYGQFDYGRLILRYDVDGSGVIDNTGRYDDESTEGILERLAALERRVNRNDGTLYTPVDQGGE